MQKKPVALDQSRHLSEEEMDFVLGEVYRIIDRPVRRSDPALKTVLLDLFGTPNSGKTTATANIERFFKRRGYHMFCPPETAEIDSVRNESTDNPLVFQARHLTGVQDYVYNLAHNRDYHGAIISRGLIDMLFWYEKGLRKGMYTDEHVAAIKSAIMEAIGLDLVDAYVYVYCDPEESMRREYERSLTKKRGSKMNEEFLSDANDVYRDVLAEVRQRFPQIPLFEINTTHLDEGEVAAEIMAQVLPPLAERMGVPEEVLLRNSFRFVRRKLDTVAHFEEQLKLCGHPDRSIIESLGWQYIKTNEEFDRYIDTAAPNDQEGASTAEIVRIRTTEDGLKLMYKGQSAHPLFSHRRPLSFPLSEEAADDMISQYGLIAELRKQRVHFHLRPPDESHFFTLHIDTIDGLGEYTEIRARGTSNETHSSELLELATQLGFTPADIVEGSYLQVHMQKNS